MRILKHHVAVVSLILSTTTATTRVREHTQGDTAREERERERAFMLGLILIIHPLNPVVDVVVVVAAVVAAAVAVVLVGRTCTNRSYLCTRSSMRRHAVADP